MKNFKELTTQELVNRALMAGIALIMVWIVSIAFSIISSVAVIAELWRF